MRRVSTVLALAAGLVAVAVGAQDLSSRPPLSDPEWKQWLDDVRPLLLKADEKEVKLTAPSQRRGFREQFWLARDPDPTTIDNPNRTQYEQRVTTAEKRFRANGKSGWNDCGTTFLLLGPPDRMWSDRAAQHFAAPDPLRTYVEEDTSATEAWVYRHPPRLPASPEGYTFRFNPSCEAIANPSALRLLQKVAESYVTRRR
jgi:GWxTD domain-containing protein